MIDTFASIDDILECGHAPNWKAKGEFGGIGFGYHNDLADICRVCYTCCAAYDRAEMIRTGEATLYLTYKGPQTTWRHPHVGTYAKLADHNRQLYSVTNWPSSLVFTPCLPVRRSKHGGGFGAQRTDVWFTGPDGATWHGINRGDSQILRCKRTHQEQMI